MLKRFIVKFDKNGILEHCERCKFMAKAPKGYQKMSKRKLEKILKEKKRI